MKAAKKLFIGVALTMIAIFVFESICNWNESRDSFTKAYNEGIDKSSTMTTKQ
jgi:hypothetical protein